MTEDRPHIRIEILSNPQYLSGARELVGSVAKRLGFSDLDCSKITLAVDEALCNVIRHGYHRCEDRPIWLSIWPIEEADHPLGIRITIEDEAKQVDPAEMQGRDLDDVKPGGLGVHIIREVMDDVRYERREQAGMKLTLIKWAEPADEPQRLSDTAPGPTPKLNPNRASS